MKKILLRTSVFLITFFVVLVLASHLLNKDHDNMTMEMGRPSLPTITMLWEGLEYNRLFGYTAPMDYASQRDSITILGKERNVDVVISPYGRQVTGMHAQLRSTDGERLIETLELQGKEEGDRLVVSLALKDLIEDEKEYLLTISLEVDGWQQMDYYTHVIRKTESHLHEELQFVQDFHDKLYHREAAKDLIKYLESNSRLESNSSFHKVNIHSSFKQITWGDLKVEETMAPVYTLKEINSQSCMLVADYQVQISEGEKRTDYRMREYFRLRYTADRMYLLDYERTMTQIPQEDQLCGGDKLLLGIGSEDVVMMENESGDMVAFQQADCLYSYQGKDQKLIRIFQFYDREALDVRNVHDEHDIKILKVDEEGNIDFAVYGYMNRGEHEGEVGIRICRYDVNKNVLEEKAFLPWKKSFSNLRIQMESLLYLDDVGMLYVYLDQAVYQICLEDGQQTKIMEVGCDGCMQVSEDHQILVWQEGEFSSEIHVQDFRTGSQIMIRAGTGERLKVLGFMGQDVIYGVARMEQIMWENGGQLFFPMARLCIAKTDGTIVKEYAQENLYVVSCSVEDNQIVLERVEQKENGTFVPGTQDHITRTQKIAAKKNKVSLVDIDVYERYVQIQVGAKIDSKNLQILRPKEVVQEGMRDIALELTEPPESYLVYGPYGVEGIYLSAGRAVNHAGKIAGVVLSNQGKLVYQKGNMASRNQILAIKDPEKVSIQESLAVCLDAMLAQRGITVESASLLERGQTVLDVMRKVTSMSPVDMTGCTLETMLYFVNRDIPVLSIQRDGEAVLVTGFNETQVVLFQPSEGRLHKMGKKEADKWFEENGNCFFTFFQ